jgi:hypothetical protein
VSPESPFAGVHKETCIFRVAPNGVAGDAVVLRAAMFINNEGNVEMGTESYSTTSRLTVKGTSRALDLTTANSGAFGIEFNDMVATEGYGSGVLMNMKGNSMIRVSNMKIGYVGMARIDSTGPNHALGLNIGVANDVIVGQSVFPTAARGRYSYSFRSSELYGARPDAVRSCAGIFSTCGIDRCPSHRATTAGRSALRDAR